MKTFFIVNPTAGRKRCLDIWNKIRTDIPFSYEFEFTSAPGQGEHLAREARNQGFTRIVAVGGDGTVSEVVNALVNTEIQLGIIPAGTGNDFVRTLGIPRDPVKALLKLVNGKPQRVDIGRVNQRYFLNVAGAGLDAEVVRATNEDVKFLTGAPAYVYALITTLFRFFPRKVVIEADGCKLERKAWLVSVANGMYYGGGMMISPASVVDDGLLEVCVVNEIGRLEIMKFLPRVFKGGHTNHPAFEVVRAKEVIIRFEEKTAAQADGDIIGAGSLELCIVPRALIIIR